MVGRWRNFLASLVLLVAFAQPALASGLGTVTAITGSAVVMRGNSVAPLIVGARIETGDRIIVKSGGRVTLSGGTVLGPGASMVTKAKSGTVQVVTTSAISSPSQKTANTSKLFSSKSGGYGGKRKDDDRDDDRDDDKYGNNKDDDDDDDHDEDDEDDEDEGHGDPDDPYPVSH